MLLNGEELEDHGEELLSGGDGEESFDGEESSDQAGPERKNGLTEVEKMSKDVKTNSSHHSSYCA